MIQVLRVIALLGFTILKADAGAINAMSSPWQWALTADVDEDVVLSRPFSADGLPALQPPDHERIPLAAIETAMEPSSPRPVYHRRDHHHHVHIGGPLFLTQLFSQSTVVALVLLLLIILATLPILRFQGVLPFLSVISYIVCLCTVKICVKELFVNGFTYPYTVTTLHMFFSAIFASMIDFPRPTEGKSTFALSMVKAASLALNNMALVFGTTAFVSIIGSSTPATTYLIELVRYRSPTLARSIGVIAVCVGTMLCIHGELAFSALATALATGACFCRSLKAVWSHDLLAINMSPYRLSAWSSIWSFLFMLIPSIIQEGLAPWRQFWGLSHYVKFVLAVSCGIATWLNIVMCFCLKYLGPVQQNVFGQLELLAVIVLSTILLHEVVTGIEWVGVVLIISGCLFTRLDDKFRKWRQALFYKPEGKAETKEALFFSPEGKADTKKAETKKLNP